MRKQPAAQAWPLGRNGVPADSGGQDVSASLPVEKRGDQRRQVAAWAIGWVRISAARAAAASTSSLASAATAGIRVPKG